ncbi:MAG: hypothetical protein JWN04_1605, partial [Myxococcaceae bacterium]|nr:hypothetical protein [Myxococcaceae bacterium]
MKYSWHRLSSLGLGVLMFAACDPSSNARDTDPSGGVDGGGAEAGSCQGADLYFGTELAKSVSAERACTSDADCTMWSPVLSCQDPAFQVLNCPLAVRSAALPALELARTRATNETCAMVDTVCAIGVSCVPSRAV